MLRPNGASTPEEGSEQPTQALPGCLGRGPDLYIRQDPVKGPQQPVQ